MSNQGEQPVIDKLTAWAKAKPDIRAVILTSSRAKPNATLDEFSDYDVIFVAEDIKPYLQDESWLDEFGRVLVVYRDPVEIRFGFERFIRVTQYETGLKIDFTLWPVDLLKHVSQMKQLPDYIDDGYRILLDKDRLMQGMKTPSCRAFVPKPPTEVEYRNFIEECFSDVPYAVKQIRRGDYFPLQFTFHLMRCQKLAKLLEWKVEIEHGWSLKGAYYGKGLQKYLDPKLFTEIENTYAGYGFEANWESLSRIIKLFSRIAKEVGERMGYNYPEELETRILKYLQKVKGGELP